MRHKKILALLVYCLALSVCAQPSDYGNFLETTADAILKFFAEMAGRLVFLGMIWAKLNAIKYEVYDNLTSYLLNDPPLDNADIAAITTYFIKILEPLFVLSIVLTGMYLIFFSGTPHGRTRAKSMLVKLIAGMVLVSLTIPIMQIIFSIASRLTQNILALGPMDIGYVYKKGIDYLNYKTADLVWINIAVAGPVFVLSLILVSGIFLVLAARFFILILLIMFFPMMIFLMLFNATKNIGKALLKHLIFWTFLPMGYALVLITIAASSMTLSGMMIDLADIISIAGAVLVLLFPFVMFKLIDWITIVAVSGLYLLGNPAKSLALSPEEEEEQEKEQETAEEAREKAGMGPGPALGSSGYQRSKKKRRFTSPLAAIGFGGTKSAATAEEEERQKKEKEQKEKEKQRSILPDQSQPLVPGLISGKKENMGDTEIVYGILGERIVRPKKPGTGSEEKNWEEGSSGGGQGGGYKTHYNLRTDNPETVRVRLGANYINTLSVDILPGETKTIEILLTNEGEDFSKLRVFDDELSAAGFHIVYEENQFGIRKGGEKLLKIKITAIESLGEAGYEGNIVFNTEKNVRSLLELKVNSKRPVGAKAPQAPPQETMAPGQEAPPTEEEKKEIRRKRSDEMLGLSDKGPSHVKSNLGEAGPGGEWGESGKEPEGVNVFERKSHTVYKRPSTKTRILEDDNIKKTPDTGGLAQPSAVRFGHGVGDEKRAHARAEFNVKVRDVPGAGGAPQAEQAHTPRPSILHSTPVEKPVEEVRDIQKEAPETMGPVMSFTRMYKFGKLINPREMHEGEKLNE